MWAKRHRETRMPRVRVLGGWTAQENPLRNPAVAACFRTGIRLSRPYRYTKAVDKVEGEVAFFLLSLVLSFDH